MDETSRQHIGLFKTLIKESKAAPSDLYSLALEIASETVRTHLSDTDASKNTIEGYLDQVQQWIDGLVNIESLSAHRSRLIEELQQHNQHIVIARMDPTEESRQLLQARVLTTALWGQQLEFPDPATAVLGAAQAAQWCCYYNARIVAPKVAREQIKERAFLEVEGRFISLLPKYLGTKNQLTVYISYQSVNEPEALQFRQYLVAANISAWAKAADLQPGSKRIEGIDQAMKMSQIIVILLGESHPKDWAAEELNVALSSSKLLKKKLIPTLLPGFRDIQWDSLPLTLRNNQPLDLRHNFHSPDCIRPLFETLDRKDNSEVKPSEATEDTAVSKMRKNLLSAVTMDDLEHLELECQSYLHRHPTDIEARKVRRGIKKAIKYASHHMGPAKNVNETSRSTEFSYLTVLWLAILITLIVSVGIALLKALSN